MHTNTKITSPVALLFFSRPDVTKKDFKEIRSVELG